MVKPGVDIDLSIFPMPVAIALGVAIVVAPLALYAWWLLGKDLSNLDNPREVSEIKTYRRWLLRLFVFVLALPVAIGLFYVSLHLWSDLASPTRSQPESTDQPTPPDGHKHGQNLIGEETDEAHPNSCRGGE